jgi:hypothetical protein
VSAEFDESVNEQVEPSSEMTAEGYDEAVQNGVPFSAEQEINAWESADPVAVTEAEAIPADDLPLLETGRDLRPDTITPAPDITSSGVEAFEAIEERAREFLAEEDEESALEASAEEAETSAPAVSEETASGGSADDDENH